MKIEKVTKKQIHYLKKCLSPIMQAVVDLHNIDINAGRGILEDNNRCLWTIDGYRITIEIFNNGGLMVSKSKEPDPEYPNKDNQNKIL